MRLPGFSTRLPQSLALLSLSLLAQSSPNLTITPPDQVSAKPGGAVTVKVAAQLDPGFHLNSHTPNEQYLIPLTLKWAPGAFEQVDVQYPAPSTLKPTFSKQPLSVLTGKFEITTKFKVAANAPAGASTVTGKLRYQACNDTSCFPPRTLEVKIPVSIR